MDEFGTVVQDPLGTLLPAGAALAAYLIWSPAPGRKRVRQVRVRVRRAVSLLGLTLAMGSPASAAPRKAAAPAPHPDRITDLPWLSGGGSPSPFPPGAEAPSPQDHAAPPWEEHSQLLQPGPGPHPALHGLRGDRTEIVPLFPRAGKTQGRRSDGPRSSTGSSRAHGPGPVEVQTIQPGGQERRRRTEPEPRRTDSTDGDLLLGPEAPLLTPDQRARAEKEACMRRHPAGKGRARQTVATGDCSSTTETAYEVKPGDTLWDISAHTLRTQDPRRIARYWPRLHRHNRDVIGTDPHLIHPGQRLRLPVESDL